VTIEIDAGKNYYGRSIDLYIFDVPKFARTEGAEHKIGIATSITFEETEPGAMREPSLRISFEAAQRLMDALWNCGIRPTEEGTAGQIEAMAAHLQDMRKLVFDFIGKIGNPPFEISGGRGPADVNNLAGIDVEKFLRG